MDAGNSYNINVPERSNFYSVLLLAWIVVAAFRKLDPNAWIYNGIMFVICAYAVYNQLQAKVTADQFKNGIVGTYVAFWAGMTLFTSDARIIQLANYSAPQKLLNGIAILPIILIWLYPARKDRFFGIKKVEKEEVINSIWRINVLLLFSIYFLNLWTWLEFLILLPIIYEPIALYLANKDRMPILTLQIQKELAQRFAVPISLTKSFFFIQFAFLFGFLHSKLWILNMMLLILAGFVWAAASFAVKLQVEDSEEDETDVVIEVGSESTTDSLAIRNGDGLVRKDPATMTKRRKGKSKAHKLGVKLREELKKPQYNLNHILSTLTQEQFANGYKVINANTVFQSKEGEWKPPEGLVIFPIELGKYDYRRTDDILLLGFNKPAAASGNDLRIHTSSKKHNYSLSSDRIQFGDVVFNLKTLIVTRKQWQKIQQNLQAVTNDTDISYTGFANLEDLQTKIVMIGDKWIELRKKAQVMAMDFLQGLLGTGDAVFINALEAEQQKLPASKDYEILDEDAT